MSPRLRLSLLAAAVGGVLALAVPASAQSIAVVVNGQPILTSEVQARSALLKLSGGKGGVSAQQELIEERLKLAEAKRYGITTPDAQVDAAFAGIAQRTKLTPEQFTQAIGQRGVSARTLKERLRAEMTWSQLVRRKFASQIAAQERDVVASIASRNDGTVSNRAVQFTLRQVVFVLPRNATEAQAAQRRAEANSARGRFPGCDGAVAFATSLRDVAVKEPIIRSSAQMGKELNEMLTKVQVGGLTAPERGDQGIEMIALCERKDIADDSMLRRQAQDELGSKQAEEKAKQYLDQLKARAVIEIRSRG